MLLELEVCGVCFSTISYTLTYLGFRGSQWPCGAIRPLSPVPSPWGCGHPHPSGQGLPHTGAAASRCWVGQSRLRSVERKIWGLGWHLHRAPEDTPPRREGVRTMYVYMTQWLHSIAQPFIPFHMCQRQLPSSVVSGQHHPWSLHQNLNSNHMRVTWQS